MSTKIYKSKRWPIVLLIVGALVLPGVTLSQLSVDPGTFVQSCQNALRLQSIYPISDSRYEKNQ